MKRLLYIDDDRAFLTRLARHVRECFPLIDPLICQNPIEALRFIDDSLDLLIVDLEMPVMDGKKLLSYAIQRGLDRRKIIVVSSRDADYLHEVFPMGECLCVLNKHDSRQLQVLDMVLASIEKKKKKVS